MSSDGDMLASAQERAEAQAKALHHSRLMARLQKEVDAIEEIRLTRKKREASRKRLLAKISVLGTTLFLAGLAAGSFGNGKISINFLDGNTHGLPQTAAQLEPQRQPPPSATPALSAREKQDTNANSHADGDAERLAVIVGSQPKLSVIASPNTMPPARPFVQGLVLPNAPIYTTRAPPLLTVPLPLVASSPSGQPPLPPPFNPPNRLPGQGAAAPAIQSSDLTDDGKEAAAAVDVVLRDRSVVVQDPPRNPVPAQVPLPAKPDTVAAAQATNQVFRVMQYLDGYVLVRVGNRVATVRVGERLPDGRLLKSVSDASITTE